MKYRRARLPHQRIEGDLLIVAPRRQTVHLLNGTGAFIWERIDEARDLGAMASLLSEEFDCDPSTARKDAQTYIEQLIRLGVLIADGEPTPQSPHPQNDSAGSTPVRMSIPDGDCSISAILPEAQGKAYDACIPLNAIVELTLACNIKCLHCYNMDRGSSQPAPAPFTTEEIKGIMGQLREAGTLFLTLTGGEIFARRDLFEILDDIERRSMAVNILTNGSLIDDARARRLAEYQNLWGASVSLYGGDAETNDRITEIPGSFDRAIRGIEHLRENGIPVSLKFIIMKGNAADVPEMIRLAERTDLPYTVDTLITPRNNGQRDTMGLRVGEQELDRLYRGPLRHLLPSVKAVEEGQFEFMCNCARAMCAIMATGDVQPCISVPMKAGNLRESSFRDIWENSPVFRRIRGLNPEDFQTCFSCEHKYYCRRDKGNAYVVSGEYTGVDEWVCRESEMIRGIVLGESQPA